MANINSINCSTLHKLTRVEVAALGLLSIGFWTVRGELKAKKQCFKTVKVNSYVTSFESTFGCGRYEFTELADDGNGKEYAVRLYSSEMEGYVKDWNIYDAVEFLK